MNQAPNQQKTPKKAQGAMPLWHRRRLLTLALAGLGVLLFWALSLPLPFLFGPMLACLLAALLGIRLKGVGQISVAARTILGVAIGASITPALIGNIAALSASLAMVPLYLICAGAIGVPWFYYVWRMNFATAYYSAMPGGLQDMVIFGSESGGDARALSLIHATRVFIIVTIAPIFLIYAYDAPLDNPLGQPAMATPWSELLLMIIAAWFGWKGAERVGLFGASILGPMIFATILALSGLLHFRPPSEAIHLAQFLIGMGLGVKFVGITLRELREFVAAGIGYALLLCLMSTFFVLVLMAPENQLDMFLAFAPGGQAEMTVLAIVTGADLGFVIAHHITRIVLVIVGAPIISRFFASRPPH